MPSGPVPFSESERINACSCSLRNAFCSSSGWSQSWRARARHSRSARSPSLLSAGPLIISCHAGTAAAAIVLSNPNRGLNGSAPPPSRYTGRSVSVIPPTPSPSDNTGTPRERFLQHPAAVGGAARDHLQRGVTVASEHVDQRVELGVVREPARNEVTVAVGVEPVRRHPERAVRERVFEQHHHELALGVGRGALPCVSAHREAAQRVVRRVREWSDGRGCLRGNGVVLGPGAPTPRYTLGR